MTRLVQSADDIDFYAMDPAVTYAKHVPYVIALRENGVAVSSFYVGPDSGFTDDISKATYYSFDEVMSMRMPTGSCFPYPRWSLEEYGARIAEINERSRRHEEAEKKHYISKYNREEFVWEWYPQGPLHAGVWAFGGNETEPNSWDFKVGLKVPDHDDALAGWWYYIGPWPVFSKNVISKDKEAVS